MNQETLDCIKGQRVCRFESWKDTSPTELARLSYGDLKPLERGQAPTDMDFLTPDMLSGSDYCSSGSVEVSNHRVSLGRYGELPNVYDVYGGYSTFAVAIRLDSITPAMIEDLNALEDYPVLDEEDHTEVEMEAENEAYESFVHSDFTKELSKQFPDLEEKIDALSTEQVDTLFYKLMDRTNTYWEHESGNIAYVCVDRVVRGATAEDITEAI